MNNTEFGNKYLKVLHLHSEQLRKIDDNNKKIRNDIDDNILQTEKLLESLGRKNEVNNIKKAPSALAKKNNSKLKLKLRTWDDITKEAEQTIEGPVSFEDILSDAELTEAMDNIKSLREEFNLEHKLDFIDWSICGVAGILAAIVDIFLISMPKNPGFLGGKGSEGGPLANLIRDKINNSLSPKEVRELEKSSWVPYDASISKNLNVEVPGLSPSMHRFRSLGHDPLLGFIFGVKDILNGSFTAIGKDGNIITQTVDMTGKDTVGMGLFAAIARVFTHLKSDVTTSAGLPAPLMPLLQLCQFGNIKGRNISEITSIMYRQGYDFRHFLAMSISPLIIEVVVRIAYMLKRLYEGKSIMESIPANLPGRQKQPKLQTMLFSAHMIATAANAGKVAVTKNPLAINYPQWCAYFRYLIPQVKWIAYEKESLRHKHVMKGLDKEWACIDSDFESMLGNSFSEKIIFIE